MWFSLFGQSDFACIIRKNRDASFYTPARTTYAGIGVHKSIVSVNEVICLTKCWKTLHAYTLLWLHFFDEVLVWVRRFGHTNCMCCKPLGWKEKENKAKRKEEKKKGEKIENWKPERKIKAARGGLWDSYLNNVRCSVLELVSRWVVLFGGGAYDGLLLGMFEIALHEAVGLSDSSRACMHWGLRCADGGPLHFRGRIRLRKGHSRATSWVTFLCAVCDGTRSFRGGWGGRSVDGVV